jgi:hypothetical protein
MNAADSQSVRWTHHAALPGRECRGSNPPIRDRKRSGFQRIPRKMTANGASTCLTQGNQKRTNPHELKESRKIGLGKPDGRAGGTGSAGVSFFDFMGVGSLGVLVWVHGDSRRHPRILESSWNRTDSVAEFGWILAPVRPPPNTGVAGAGGLIAAAIRDFSIRHRSAR